MLQVARYGKTRFWALWDGQDLVAVVVYKKGATELLRRLAAQRRAVAEAAAEEAAPWRGRRGPAPSPPARPEPPTGAGPQPAPPRGGKAAARPP